MLATQPGMHSPASQGRCSGGLGNAEGRKQRCYAFITILASYESLPARDRRRLRQLSAEASGYAVLYFRLGNSPHCEPRVQFVSNWYLPTSPLCLPLCGMAAC